MARFTPAVLTEDEEQLRSEVRAFLAEELPPGSYAPGLGMNGSHSPEFSKKLAQRGWLGMAVPPRYGGHGRTAVDRFIVVEELLAAGAPVGAHWIADRQTAPALLTYGTEEQRERLLPAISAGECYFSIGMSEPDAGSDLASVLTMATRVPDGWSVSGTKIWTSGAHLNHFCVVLCRTSPLEDDRHHGLSQLIVDLTSPGITINPIPFLDGSHHFNEIVLDEVFVPDDMVLGDVGMGWQQVTSELSYERSGPDRFLPPGCCSSGTWPSGPRRRRGRRRPSGGWWSGSGPSASCRCRWPGPCKRAGLLPSRRPWSRTWAPPSSRRWSKPSRRSSKRTRIPGRRPCLSRCSLRRW